MSNVVESTFPSFFLSLSFPSRDNITPPGSQPHTPHLSSQQSQNSIQLYYRVLSVKPMKCLHDEECILHLVTLRSFEVTLYFVLTPQPTQPGQPTNTIRTTHSHFKCFALQLQIKSKSAFDYFFVE